MKRSLPNIAADVTEGAAIQYDTDPTTWIVIQTPWSRRTHRGPIPWLLANPDGVQRADLRDPKWRFI